MARNKDKGKGKDKNLTPAQVSSVEEPTATTPDEEVKVDENATEDQVTGEGTAVEGDGGEDNTDATGTDDGGDGTATGDGDNSTDDGDDGTATDDATGTDDGDESDDEKSDEEEEEVKGLTKDEELVLESAYTATIQNTINDSGVKLITVRRMIEIICANPGARVVIKNKKLMDKLPAIIDRVAKLRICGIFTDDQVKRLHKAFTLQK